VTCILHSRNATSNLLSSPIVCRMIFHDCVGGCDGCVDLTNSKNTGLAVPIQALEPIQTKYNLLSRSDIWALAAITGAHMTQTTMDFDMKWYGRVNCESDPACVDPNGAACTSTTGPARDQPGFQLTTHELYSFFQNEFGFNQRDTVAIMGAHTIGTMVRTVSFLDYLQLILLSKCTNSQFLLASTGNWHRCTEWMGKNEYYPRQ
jgi:Peroxidase